MMRFSIRILSSSHLARVLVLKSMLEVARSASPPRGGGASVMGRRQPRSQRKKLQLPREHREARARRKPSQLAMTSHMASRTRHATSVGFGGHWSYICEEP
jgi:RNA 3'-terminal phosphate cyclase